MKIKIFIRFFVRTEFITDFGIRYFLRPILSQYFMTIIEIIVL